MVVDATAMWMMDNEEEEEDEEGFKYPGCCRHMASMTGSGVCCRSGLLPGVP